MTVRQLLLVVILVGASFLGGAFVNGPGLQWAQVQVLRSFGLNNSGEIASVELKATTSSELELKTPGDGLIPPNTLTGTVQGPAAPVPSFQTEAESAKQDVSGEPEGLTSQPGLPISKAAPPVGQLLSPSVAKPSIAIDTSKDHAPTRSDHKVTPATVTAQNDSSFNKLSKSANDSAPAILDSLAALLPVDSSTSARLPRSLPSHNSDSAARVSETDSWVVLERKMASLGVVRYTIDGTPGDSVVFSCLIPLAGRQAVAQRFEGEGDDIIHAAQAALRRITLWRASQPSLP